LLRKSYLAKAKRTQEPNKRKQEQEKTTQGSFEHPENTKHPGNTQGRFNLLLYRNIEISKEQGKNRDKRTPESPKTPRDVLSKYRKNKEKNRNEKSHRE